MSAASPTRPGTSGARQAAFSSLLALAMAAATFAISVLSVLARFLIDDFGLSHSQLGWLVTGVAGVAALASPAAGRATDALGGKTVLLATFSVAALTTLGMAAAPSYAWLLAFALLSGIGNAGCNPATNKLISSQLPPGRRGLTMGVKQSGVQGGLFLAGALLPPAALAFGWRLALSLAGMFHLLAALVAWRVIPPDPVAAEAAVVGPGRYRHGPAVRWLAVYGFLMGAGGAAVVGYVPLYAEERVGMSVTTAGAAAAVIGLVGFAARIAWSRQSEAAGHFSTPLALLGLVSVASAAAVWAASAAGPWVLWLGAVGAGAGVVAWNAVGMLAVVAQVETRHAGQASGMVLFGFLGGYTSSPVLFGYSVDRTGGYDLGWAAVTLLFGAAVLVTRLWRRSDPGLAIR
ncbi:MAG: MFS transporter [Actinomycetota bacterium]|nr:MFS transporter [Actinomycetota bacterium]